MGAGAERPALLASDRWLTPYSVIERAQLFVGALRRCPSKAKLDLDPCTEPENPVGAVRWYYPPAISKRGARAPVDGLTTPWNLEAGDVAWVNCPYSRGSVLRWTKRLIEEVPHDAHALLLVKSDPTTRWHACARASAAAMLRFNSRLRFLAHDGEPATGANFASDLFYFGARPHLFADVFRDAGYVEALR
jgi:hypothetical protein